MKKFLENMILLLGIGAVLLGAGYLYYNYKSLSIEELTKEVKDYLNAEYDEQFEDLKLETAGYSAENEETNLIDIKKIFGADGEAAEDEFYYFSAYSSEYKLKFYIQIQGTRIDLKINDNYEMLTGLLLQKNNVYENAKHYFGALADEPKIYPLVTDAKTTYEDLFEGTYTMTLRIGIRYNEEVHDAMLNELGEKLVDILKSAEEQVEADVKYIININFIEGTEMTVTGSSAEKSK